MGSPWDIRFLHPGDGLVVCRSYFLNLLSTRDKCERMIVCAPPPTVWAPRDCGSCFLCSVNPGISTDSPGLPTTSRTALPIRKKARAYSCQSKRHGRQQRKVFTQASDIPYIAREGLQPEGWMAPLSPCAATSHQHQTANGSQLTMECNRYCHCNASMRYWHSCRGILPYRNSD